MVPTPQYAGARVVVMGLGKSGLSAATSLRASGAAVEVWDDKPQALAEGTAKGFAAFDGAAMNLAGVRSIIWSPGIPHGFPKNHALAMKARNQNIPLVCDVDLLVEFDPKSKVTLFDLPRVQEAFSPLFGNRRIDLATPEILENPFRRRAIEPDLKVLYAA